MVIKTASLSVRVKDVDAAFARAMQLTEASGGYVQSSTQSVEGGQRADLTLRVPPDEISAAHQLPGGAGHAGEQRASAART